MRYSLLILCIPLSVGAMIDPYDLDEIATEKLSSLYWHKKSCRVGASKSRRNNYKSISQD
jgi:hypothetical protein